MRKKIVFIMAFFMLGSLTPISANELLEDTENNVQLIDGKVSDEIFDQETHKSYAHFLQMIDKGQEWKYLLVHHSHPEGDYYTYGYAGDDSMVFYMLLRGKDNPEIQFSGKENIYEIPMVDLKEEGNENRQSALSSQAKDMDILGYYYIVDEKYFSVNEDYEHFEVKEGDKEHKTFLNHIKAKELGDDWYRRYDGKALHPMYDDYAILKDGVVEYIDHYGVDTYRLDDSDDFEEIRVLEDPAASIRVSVPFDDSVKAYRVESKDLEVDYLELVRIDTKSYVEDGGHNRTTIHVHAGGNGLYKKPTNNFTITAYDYEGKKIFGKEYIVDAPLIGPNLLDIRPYEDRIEGWVYDRYEGQYAIVFPDGSIIHDSMSYHSSKFEYRPQSKVVNLDDTFKLIMRNYMNGAQISLRYNFKGERVLDKTSFSDLLEDVRRIDYSRYTEESRSVLEETLAFYGCQSELDFLKSSQKAKENIDINYEQASIDLMKAISYLQAKDSYKINFYEKINLAKYDEIYGQREKDDTEIVDKDKEESKDQESVVNTKPVPEKVDENKEDSAKNEGKDILPETGIGSNTLMHASGLVVLGFILRKKSKQ